MRPIPNLEDAEAMAAWGRRSALLSARKEALELLRDACTAAQGADIGEHLIEHAKIAKYAAERLVLVAELWQGTK